MSLTCASCIVPLHRWPGLDRSSRKIDDCSLALPQGQRASTFEYPVVDLPQAQVRPRKRVLRKGLRVLTFAGFVLALAFGAMTFAQAWSMTHYEPATAHTTRIADVAGGGKLRLLLCGPTIRRQSNTKTPRDIGADYETVRIKGYDGLQLEGWRLADGAAGGAPMVVMIPGYGASKDTLLAAAQEFRTRGFAVWIFDPHGIGGSEGRVTSLGFHEAEDVAAAFREVRRAN